MGGLKFRGGAVLALDLVSLLLAPNCRLQPYGRLSFLVRIMLVFGALIKRPTKTIVFVLGASKAAAY